MLCNIVIIVLVIGCTCPQAIPLAMSTMIKGLHLFLFLYMHVVLFLSGYSVPLGSPSAHQSSAKNVFHYCCFCVVEITQTQTEGQTV